MDVLIKNLKMIIKGKKYFAKTEYMRNMIITEIQPIFQ